MSENNPWSRLPKTDPRFVQMDISAYDNPRDVGRGGNCILRVPYSPHMMTGYIATEDYCDALIGMYREKLGDAETRVEKNVQAGWDRLHVRGAHPLIADLDTSGTLDFRYSKDDATLDSVVKGFVERLRNLK